MTRDGAMRSMSEKKQNYCETHEYKHDGECRACSMVKARGYAGRMQEAFNDGFRGSLYHYCQSDTQTLRAYHEGASLRAALIHTALLERNAVQAEPVQAEPVQAEPVQAEPVQAEPVQAEQGRADLTGGVKHDGGKARYDLLPPDALEELVAVYTMGAAKYADRNWEKGLSFSRVFAAIMRHLWAWMRGEDVDSESGLHHAAHAAFGCLALVAYSRRGMAEFDDRPTKRKEESELHG